MPPHLLELGKVHHGTILFDYSSLQGVHSHLYPVVLFSQEMSIPPLARIITLTFLYVKYWTGMKVLLSLHGIIMEFGFLPAFLP